MKRFFSDMGLRTATEPSTAGKRRQDPPAEWSAGPLGGSEVQEAAALTARLAIYDSLAAAPRIEDVSCSDDSELIEALAARAYGVARDRGGRIPYVAIREVVENLMHASFNEVVVTILDDGNTLRFSDQGPGILDKERAFLPGFSTATAEMKSVIRGVGSGLPIVRECLSFAGGGVTVDDNLGCGTVITLRATPEATASPDISSSGGVEDGTAPRRASAERRLSTRQKKVLSLVMELGSAGPSLIAKELSVGLSTAYRDLAFLESAGLIHSDASGKRVLSSAGVEYLDGLFGTRI